MGVLMTPGAAAFTRMPLSAYSIARDRVTASSPPLVSAVRADGTPFTGWRSRYPRTRAAPIPCDAPVMTTTLRSLLIMRLLVKGGFRRCGDRAGHWFSDQFDSDVDVAARCLRVRAHLVCG